MDHGVLRWLVLIFIHAVLWYSTTHMFVVVCDLKAFDRPLLGDVRRYQILIKFEPLRGAE